MLWMSERLSVSGALLGLRARSYTTRDFSSMMSLHQASMYSCTLHLCAARRAAGELISRRHHRRDVVAARLADIIRFWTPLPERIVHVVRGLVAETHRCVLSGTGRHVYRVVMRHEDARDVAYAPRTVNLVVPHRGRVGLVTHRSVAARKALVGPRRSRRLFIVPGYVCRVSAVVHEKSDRRTTVP